MDIQTGPYTSPFMTVTSLTTQCFAHASLILFIASCLSLSAYAHLYRIVSQQISASTYTIHMHIHKHFPSVFPLFSRSSCWLTIYLYI